MKGKEVLKENKIEKNSDLLWEDLKEDQTSASIGNEEGFGVSLVADAFAEIEMYARLVKKIYFPSWVISSGVFEDIFGVSEDEDKVSLWGAEVGFFDASENKDEVLMLVAEDKREGEPFEDGPDVLKYEFDGSEYLG